MLEKKETQVTRCENSPDNQLETATVIHELKCAVRHIAAVC